MRLVSRLARETEDHRLLCWLEIYKKGSGSMGFLIVAQGAFILLGMSAGFVAKRVFGQKKALSFLVILAMVTVFIMAHSGLLEPVNNSV
ncbi:hypothetical protein A9Q89_06600 [Gammaproteobacteria bacterium 53_120_T64]|nr:hypothetical protein A9Q89_06600 [Gammaproteobacteria bacterium 53_120_T64]